MNIIIRPYIGSDRDSIFACIRELKSYESQFDQDYLCTEESVQDLFNDLINKNASGGKIFVAANEKSVIGFASIEIQNKNDPLIVDKNTQCVYVSDIVILPKYRKQGIGQLLLHEIEKYALSQSIKFIKLIVFSDNLLAFQFYTHSGFRNYETTLIKEL